MTRTPVTDWQELSALYERADALDGAVLDAWLAGLEAESHPLLAQLRQMLDARAQVQENGFLDTPAHLPQRPEPVLLEWAAGQRIGRYRLLRHLGTGGMAEVWLAQRVDGAFRRMVAIKLLFRHAASHQRDTFAQRFARERDILASLNHPNIAGLHDAGMTRSGQPWLALEYVEGESPTAWCDAARLSVEARVRLFRQVLLAVQHAHANLVIHRDLKPANILVTPQGEVRLLDFGIAKLVAPDGGALVETELTRQAGRPLTVQYASPEQLTGQPLTTACDVYSLGVVLYELLCGERPYALKVESVAQLEQAILEVEPREPSRRELSDGAAAARGVTVQGLRKRLASDLDAIVLKALAKRPDQRYGSVEALRADLDRWLAGEAVDARTPSRSDRLRKFVGRHALSVSLGVGAVIALTSVATAAVWLGLQARQESARAVASRDFLLDMFKRADPEKARGASITAGELLERGRQDAMERLGHQPQLQIDLLQGIGSTLFAMGEYVTADGPLDHVAQGYERMGAHRLAALARADHAENVFQIGDLDRAAALVAQARLDAAPALPDAEVEARLAWLEGWIANDQGDAVRAQERFSTSFHRAGKGLGPSHLKTLQALQGLAQSAAQRLDFQQALALGDEIAKRLEAGPAFDARDHASFDFVRADTLYVAGQYRRALEAATLGLQRCTAQVGPNDESCRLLVRIKVLAALRMGVAAGSPADLMALRAMANERLSPGRQALALQLMCRVASATSRQPPDAACEAGLTSIGDGVGGSAAGAPSRVLALLALADANLRAGQPGQALRWVERSGLDRIATTAPNVHAWGTALKGVALLQAGSAARALPVLEASHAEQALVSGADHPLTQVFALNQAVALGRLGRTAEALSLVDHGLPALLQAMGERSPTYLNAIRVRDWLRNGRVRAPGPASEAGDRAAVGQAEELIFI